MNAQNAKDYLPFVQALAEGKTIQAKNIAGCWQDVIDPAFSSSACDYRVKPEPRRWWIYEREGPGHLHAVVYARHAAVPEDYIEVVEVIK